MDTKRNKFITIYVSAEELNRIRERFSQTACRNMSEYGRQVLLGKPVVVLHRNHSLDQQLHEVIRLRKTLEDATLAFDQLREQSNWYRSRIPGSSLLSLLLQEYALGQQLQQVKRYFQKMNAQWWR
jgi:hypothetical protein